MIEPVDFTLLANCPKCESLWHDKPIPKESQHLYGYAQFFSRLIGLYDLDRDRTVAWQCPDCNTRWDRATGKIQKPFEAIK
jgi:ssDNA-binding Zn-finger/Zn-ribbon topoisomerase 1